MFRVEEKVRAELGQISRGRSIDDGRARSIGELIKELEAAVAEAEAEVAIARVDRLRMAMSDRLGREFSVQDPGPEEVSGLAAGPRLRLMASHVRMIGVGEALLESIGSSQSDTIAPASLTSEIESAKAEMKSADLARECAKAGLDGYLQFTYPHEQKRYEQELAQAKIELEAATKRRVTWDERFEQNKGVAPENSARSLDREYNLEARRLVAQLEEKAAGLSIEQAESNLRRAGSLTKR